MLRTLAVMDRIHLARSWIQHFTILCVVAFSLSRCDSDLTCIPGIDIGVTIPRGDIFIEEGEPLRIRCELNINHVNVQQKNASSLYFVHDGIEVPSEMVSILDESAIELFDPAPKPSNSLYACHYRHDDQANNRQGVGICVNRVAVGFPPGKHPVTNISCISYNWQNLTCSWTPPPNFVKTEYQIVLHEVGKRNPYYKCPETTRRENSCTWNHFTDPMYRQFVEQYNATITGTNVFGKDTQYFLFNSSEIVLPNKPELTVLSRTSSSILLHWRVLFPLETFPPGLQQRVEFQTRWELGVWQTADTSSLGLRSVNYTYNLTNLKYANTHYDIRVSMKSASAKDDSFWSPPASDTVKTMPAVPSSPPKTDVGTFQVAEESQGYRTIFVYWQQIPDYMKNGDDFEYKVIEVEEDGNIINKKPQNITDAYAEFGQMRNFHYEFTVVSTNKVGRSLESSRVVVPDKLYMPLEPKSFTKVAHEHGVYELSWEPSKEPPGEYHIIKNYTVFWCDNDRDWPYQCKGVLNWIFVDKTTRMINITTPDPKKNYQFAISANSKQNSSGMVWAQCTILNNRVIGKISDIWTHDVKSTSIDVSWRFDCLVRPGLLTGFRIFYCIVLVSNDKNCTGPEQILTLGNQSNTTTIRNLKPNKTYKISMSVLTANYNGTPSDSIPVTTLEAAPDEPPMNLRLDRITNNSAILTWDPPPPEAHNGRILYYEIYCNSNKSNTSNSDTWYQLEGLRSYENYSVSVSACTQACSIPSAPQTFMTLTGVPGGIGQPPTVEYLNNTEPLVHWTIPTLKGGKLDYYEVEITEADKKNQTPIIKEVYNRTETDVECTSRSSRYVRVRAVNIAGNNETLEGPWSSPGTVQCLPAGWEIPGLLLFILLCIVITAGAGWAGKVSWRSCAEMKDLHPVLPPSLNGICDDKNKEEFSLPMQNWTGPSKKDENMSKTDSDTDEELLLKRKEVDPDHDDSADDLESKPEAASEGDSLTISSSDNNHSSHKSHPNTKESYKDKVDGGTSSTPKGSSSDRNSTYVQVGAYVPNLPPPESSPSSQQPTSKSAYISNSCEASTANGYVKAHELLNPSQVFPYCQVGNGPSEAQNIPNAGTRLLQEEPKSGYVFVGDCNQLDRNQTSIPT